MKKTVAKTMLGVLIMISSLFGCFRHKGMDVPGLKGRDGIGDKGAPNSSELIGFRYSYNVSRSSGSYTYKIEDNQFTYELTGHDEYAEMTEPVDEELLGKLKDLYIESESYKWDGYSKSATNVLDGNGFSVYFRFADGRTCSAGGSNCAPENYDRFCSGMEELLKPLADDIAERGKQKRIAEGFPGNVDSLLANFIQQGDSGDDQYFFNIRITDNPSVNNLDISIHSASGAFLPEGDYRYIGHLDQKYIDFSELNELIETYQLVNWYDYDVAAEDYNNAEWFQIEIKFDDDKHLSAMGTEKPENYDAFRQEFLTYMVGFIDRIKDVYRPYE